MAVVPHGLLVTDGGEIGELSRRQAILSEVLIKEHAPKVTISGTGVNILLTDSDKRFVYPRGMKYPNRLAEIMDKKGVDGPTLARAADTSKQQILKLRKGERKLTRHWAEKFAPALGCSWPEIMGWTGNPPSAKYPPGIRLLKSEALPPAPGTDGKTMLQVIGIRIGFARSDYRRIDLAEAADRFGMSVEHLSNIEKGAETITVPEVIEIATKLQVPLEFLLQGLTDDLPHKVALEWEAKVAG